MKIANPLVMPILSMALLSVGFDFLLIRNKYGEGVVVWEVEAAWSAGPWHGSKMIYTSSKQQ